MTVSSKANRRSPTSGIVDPRYQESIDFLVGQINYERRPELAQGLGSFRLDRMRSLLEKLGNPQNETPCIHVAGSKGKGSTATMIASILEASGKKVGLFTSPHAHRFEERFTVDGKLPTETEVVQIVDQLRAVATNMEDGPDGSPTFFELATAAGWLHFQNCKVDIAIVEVGLGGRLDSTNVCRSIVCVITSISKDHTRLLGNTVELIAREKAGIIKTDVPVISGVLADGPAKVIQAVSTQVAAPMEQLGREFHVHSMAPQGSPLSPWAFDYLTDQFQFAGLKLAMLGEHQTRNAALAISAVKRLDRDEFNITEKSIRTGLATAKIPLRIELVQTDPSILIDAAHNPASIQALCNTIQACNVDKKICVFASSRDKDCVELLRILNQYFDEFVLCEYQENPRSIPVDELAKSAEGVLTQPFSVRQTPQEAMKHALALAAKNDLICATGSFFLAAEVEQCWQASQREA